MKTIANLSTALPLVLRSDFAQLSLDCCADAACHSGPTASRAGGRKPWPNANPTFGKTSALLAPTLKPCAGDATSQEKSSSPTKNCKSTTKTVATQLPGAQPEWQGTVVLGGLGTLTDIARDPTANTVVGQVLFALLDDATRSKAAPNEAYKRLDKIVPWFLQEYAKKLPNAAKIESVAKEWIKKRNLGGSRKNSEDCNSITPFHRLSEVPPRNKWEMREQLCQATLEGYLTGNQELARKAFALAQELGIPNLPLLYCDDQGKITPGFANTIRQELEKWFGDFQRCRQIAEKQDPDSKTYDEGWIHAYNWRTFQPLTFDSAEKDAAYWRAYNELRELDRVETEQFAEQTIDDQPLDRIKPANRIPPMEERDVTLMVLVRLAREGRMGGSRASRLINIRDWWEELHASQMLTPESNRMRALLRSLCTPKTPDVTHKQNWTGDEYYQKCLRAVLEEGDLLKEEVRAAREELKKRDRIDMIRRQGPIEPRDLVKRLAPGALGHVYC